MQVYRILLISSLRVAAVVWLLLGIYRTWTGLALAFDPLYRDASSEAAWTMFALENVTTAIFPSLFLAAAAEILSLSVTRTFGKEMPS